VLSRNVLRKDVWERIKQDFTSLLKIVKENGTSLIGIGNHIKERTVESLLGLRYTGTSFKKGNITVEKDHFITRDMQGRAFGEQSQDCGLESADVIVEKGEVLATQDGRPIITCSERDSPSKVAWIGGHSPAIFNNYRNAAYLQEMHSVEHRIQPLQKLRQDADPHNG